ncbi:hypothetical protein [Acinetobacter pragensis]|uniref:GAPS4 PD-(D/E)XK nuclease domain-containing protein n=1 Tax=Acinetobacter pragensis TaxID=1806892 RepID=A0A151Y5D8_9GAMM|nr:hypothetical protein [Acinetobacter pragensis]KYQ73209.1 hypothetical protein AZH43_07215 [Acinetobacter pragensis]
MAETSNIGKMAALISEELFNYFGWEKCTFEDLNWKCENAEHEKNTHPADVVFYYNDPYTNTVTYIHTDLKSFSESTLSSLNLNEVLQSLSMQVECSEISEEWQTLYLEGASDFKVHGMLFIYNHDNKYIKSLTSKFNKVTNISINTPKNSRLYILDPSDIYWLNNIALHLGRLQHKKQISSDYTFFYPQRKDQATIGNSKAATIELLKSPFIILEDKTLKTVIIFYRAEGEEIDEFVYLIDYLRHHQLLDIESKITIYQLEQCAFAPANFKNAIRKCESLLNIKDPDLKDLLNKIDIQKIKHFTTEFSEIEIGMALR